MGHRGLPMWTLVLSSPGGECCVRILGCWRIVPVGVEPRAFPDRVAHWATFTGSSFRFIGVGSANGNAVPVLKMDKKMDKKMAGEEAGRGEEEVDRDNVVREFESRSSIRDIAT